MWWRVYHILYYCSCILMELFVMQCQMGKQTMGTPSHAFRYRNDNKLYRIQNPQVPLVQNESQAEYQMDEYPQGTNAVVAVIAYTGYDMEDAMIINKSSFQRGFGHGSVYKTAVIDLDEEEKKGAKSGSRPNLRFHNIKPSSIGEKRPLSYSGERYCDSLDNDGLPFEGEILEQGDPICCFVDDITGEHRVIKHKDIERAYVSVVRVLGPKGPLDKTSRKSSGGATNKVNLKKVSITLRYRRVPIIGDKFSSRHGQKGTLSVLWPQVCE